MASLTGSVLRVATWNVQEFRFEPEISSTRYLRSLRKVVEEISSLDILALQEVRFRDDGRASLIDLIKDQTPLKNIYSKALSPSMFTADATSGLAIASRLPLEPTIFSTLPNPNLSTRWNDEEKETYDKGIIAASTQWEGHVLSVASLHSFPFHRFGRSAADSEFADIWASLTDTIDQLPAGLRLVCGDFNTEVRSLVLQRLHEPLVSLFTGIITSQNYEIDDILCSNAFEQAMPPRAIRTLSDHKLCVASLKVRS